MILIKTFSGECFFGQQRDLVRELSQFLQRAFELVRSEFFRRSVMDGFLKQRCCVGFRADAMHFCLARQFRLGFRLDTDND